MVVAGVGLIIASIWWTLNTRAANAIGWAEPGASTNPPLVSSLASGQPAALPTGAVNSAPSLPKPTTNRRIPYPNIPRVGLVEAKAAFDDQAAVFIDARGELLFMEGHIPGSIPFTEEELPLRINELDKNAWIIPYCT